MQSPKPYNVRERLFVFATDVVCLAEFLRTRGPAAVALIPQLVNAANSAAANAEEADDASSRRDFLAKERIALREVKETRHRLQILRAANLLAAQHDGIIDESDQLVRILSTIIRNADRGE